MIKNWLYSKKILTPKNAPLPIISVGNITFGGTEKTPLVINLISSLINNSFKVAMISRGYKGKWEKKGGILSDGEKILGTWEDSGDEPYMVAQNIPQAGIFIGKNRLLSCQRAKDYGFELAVLDDGFQHRRLHRDLDIVLYSPGKKITLRESTSSLKRADILLIKKEADIFGINGIKERFPESAIHKYSVQRKGFFSLREKERNKAEMLKEKKVLAFCGIARPERFLSILQDAGIEPVSFLKFPDHHPFPFSTLENIKEKCQKSKAEVIITTEKDSVKIIQNMNFINIPVFYLKIGLELEEEFYSRVLHRFKGKT